MKFQNLYILIVIAGFFIASSGGRNDNRAGAPGDQGTCANCHGGAATNLGTVDLVGLPAEFEPGQTYDFQIVVNEPAAAGDLDEAGFQLVATDGFNNFQRGTFTVVDPGTRINFTNRLVQSAPKSYTGTQASWDVQYTAPNDPTLFQDIIFYYVGNSVDGTGGTGGDVVYANSSLIVLPVEWKSFNVVSLDRGNYITWETAQEFDNDYFEIQRSSNGTDFETITTIKGSSFSAVSSAYEFMDETFSSSISYYRILQVDFDGKEDFSKIVSVENQLHTAEVELYPTTIESDLYIKSSKDFYISIFNSAGQLIIQKENVTSISFEDHQSGIYYAQIFSTQGIFIETKKIIKI